MTDPPINIHIHAGISRRQRAQLLRALSKGETMTTPVASKAPPFKPGYKTTEMWLGILTAVGAVGASAANDLPPQYALYAGIVSYLAYALSRGIAKH